MKYDNEFLFTGTSKDRKLQFSLTDKKFPLDFNTETRVALAGFVQEEGMIDEAAIELAHTVKVIVYLVCFMHHHSKTLNTTELSIDSF